MIKLKKGIVFHGRYSLEKKTKKFENWYFKNFVSGHYTDIGEFRVPKDLKHLIKKIAVWYELKYPDTYIEKSQDEEAWEKSFNKMKGNSNSFLAYKDFWERLSHREHCMLAVPQYAPHLFLNSKREDHIHLTKSGVIVGIDTTCGFKEEPELEKKYNGMYIEEYIEQKEVRLSIDNEIKPAIKRYNDQQAIRDGILDCALYEIIEAGGNRMGPRRAFMFAQEFDRDIGIPMMYGIDTSDPYLLSFIKEYINAGGNLELECYYSYFSRNNEKETLRSTTLKNYVKRIQPMAEDNRKIKDSLLTQ